MKKLIFILAMLVTFNVYAEDPHHEHTTEGTTIIETTVVEENTTVIQDNSAIAAALGGHHFDYGTYVEQKSVSAATIDGSIAISGAFAHRECRECGLFSTAVSVGHINHKTKVGAVIGYTWSY